MRGYITTGDDFKLKFNLFKFIEKLNFNQKFDDKNLKFSIK